MAAADKSPDGLRKRARELRIEASESLKDGARAAVAEPYDRALVKGAVLHALEAIDRADVFEARAEKNVAGRRLARRRRR
ncbi:MAG: hypothetical protein ACYDC2_03210 [Solirubrobacteraceae bacterium]